MQYNEVLLIVFILDGSSECDAQEFGNFGIFTAFVYMENTV